MASKRYTDKQFIDAVKTSKSYAEVIKTLGLSTTGGNYVHVKAKIKRLSLDISHFTHQSWSKGLTAYEHPSIKRKPLSDVLVENSNRASSYVRQRLIREGVKESKCEFCGRTEWLGVPIPLELHHINGDHFDNRIENLLILCPNCHALTDSHINNDKIKEFVETGVVDVMRLNELYLEDKESKKERKSSFKERKKNRRSPRYCLNCGVELGHGEKRFCSQKCSHEYICKRPDVGTLKQDFIDLKSFVQVGRKYGVSDNAVKKWCIFYGILDDIKKK